MITDVHHAGIAVRSLEAALAFFHGALGLPVAKRSEVPDEGARVALLAVGGSFVEVIQPDSDISPFASHIAQHGEGLHHLALRSSRVDDDLSRLRDLGVPLIEREPRPSVTGRRAYLSPAAFEGALVEIVEPQADLDSNVVPGAIIRIDHVVLHMPDVVEAGHRFLEWFDLPIKRRMERGSRSFAFLRPGDVVIEVVGPVGAGSPGTGRVAGVAFEVRGIDRLVALLQDRGYPVGKPHPAIQGGRIASVHPSGCFGVPVAFIDFTGRPGQPSR